MLLLFDASVIVVIVVVFVVFVVVLVVVVVGLLLFLLLLQFLLLLSPTSTPRLIPQSQPTEVKLDVYSTLCRFSLGEAVPASSNDLS